VWNERIEKHAPIVAMSATMAALWAVLRDWRSSAASSPRRTLLARLRSALTQAVYASLGASIAAGMMEPVAVVPWAVASFGATAGVVIDVVSANGPKRMADLTLRYLERVKRIMRDK